MKIRNFIGAIVLMTTVIGCASGPNRLNSSDGYFSVNENEYALIARNLVSVLAQLEKTNPLKTTFQMENPSTPFGKAVMNEVEAKGYGIQIVSGDLGSSFLRYRAETAQSEFGYTSTYSLDIAGTVIEREFSKDGRYLMPSSTLKVKGTHEHYFVLDDALFESTPDSEISDIVIIADEVPDFIVIASADSETEATTIIKQSSNVYDLQQSNYKSLFANYKDVEKHTLIFGNDSLRLGKDNKKLVSSLSERIDPDTDIISVIGCSHGRSALENGNQVLAEGRTQRVKESFMFAGIPSDIILEEACWAGEYWDEMAPRRGVMVTHKTIIN